MHELTGKIAGVSFSIEGMPLVALQLNERKSAMAMLDELKSLEKLTVKLGKFKTLVLTNSMLISTAQDIKLSQTT